MTKLKLLKPLKWGWNFIASGVIKTENEWCEMIGRPPGCILPLRGSDKEFWEVVA